MLCQRTISYRDTALAILSEKDGLTALNRNKIPNPLHLLVKEMPGKVHVQVFCSGFLLEIEDLVVWRPGVLPLAVLVVA